MKRDMDLVRLILLEIESSEYDEIEDFKIDGYDVSLVKYNGELLLQAGLINNFYEDSIGELIAGQLTWEGCDYLDKIRDNSIWKKTKDAIKEKGLKGAISDIAGEVSGEMSETVKKTNFELPSSKCPQCGSPVTIGKKYCPDCGTKVQ